MQLEHYDLFCLTIYPKAILITLNIGKYLRLIFFTFFRIKSNETKTLMFVRYIYIRFLFYWVSLLETVKDIKLDPTFKMSYFILFDMYIAPHRRRMEHKQNEVQSFVWRRTNIEDDEDIPSSCVVLSIHSRFQNLLISALNIKLSVLIFVIQMFLIVLQHKDRKRVLKNEVLTLFSGRLKV